MPEIFRRPRRRLDRGAAEGDFTSEIEAREAAAALRAAFPSIEAAEASFEWHALHRRLTRWVLRTAMGLPVVNAEESARALARLYLVAPHFLPGLPPANTQEIDG